MPKPQQRKEKECGQCGRTRPLNRFHVCADCDANDGLPFDTQPDDNAGQGASQIVVN